MFHLRRLRGGWIGLALDPGIWVGFDYAAAYLSRCCACKIQRIPARFVIWLYSSCIRRGQVVLQSASGSELAPFWIVSVLFRRVFEIVLQLTNCILGW